MKLVTLYRPVGVKELELIIASGMRGFPPRLEWQPVFYPVLNFNYAAQIALEWNTKDEFSGYAGFVTAFDIPCDYFETFTVEVVGGEMHRELWVPAKKMHEFNSRIQGSIRILAAYYGELFKGKKYDDLITKKMIRERTGDLIEEAGSFDVIVHGANCMCTMRKGIAPQIKAAFPEAYAVDQETIKGDRNKLGTITFTKHTAPVVVNAYTQYDFIPGKMHCDYDAVRSCMKAIKKQFGGKKIGMPKIGAGLAGGDWGIIRSIIEEELGEEDVTIVLWNKE